MAKSASRGKRDGKRGAAEKHKKRDVDEKRSGRKRADTKPDKKHDKKKHDKRAGKAKDADRAADVKAVDFGKPARGAGVTKLKSVKLKRAEGTQRLVEQVAAEIVIAELERAGIGVDTAAKPALVPQSAELVKSAAGEGKEGKKGKREDGDGKKAKAGGEDAAADTGETADKGENAEQDAEDAAVAFTELLRVQAGPVDLAAIDPGSTLGASSRERAEEELPKLAARLEELQERLFAAARGGNSNRRVLLVLQGMDTSGKGGTVRHVVGQLDPNGTRLTAFKAPTEEERAHDFLWRIRRALPVAGEVGIFDRSHYEDVLIARVRKLVPPMVIGRRYQLINGFERNLVADGTVLVKCFLHISPDEQKQRLLARLDDPAKVWKYNPGDVDERALWPQYQDAYRLVLEKCSTEEAPWYVVPADHKWYRNYAITRLLVEALERIDPAYPPGDFDVEAERQRVLAS